MIIYFVIFHFFILEQIHKLKTQKVKKKTRDLTSNIKVIRKVEISTENITTIISLVTILHLISIIFLGI